MSGCGPGACSWMQPWWRRSAVPHPPPASAPGHLPLPPYHHPAPAQTIIQHQHRPWRRGGGGGGGEWWAAARGARGGVWQPRPQQPWPLALPWAWLWGTAGCQRCASKWGPHPCCQAQAHIRSSSSSSSSSSNHPSNLCVWACWGGVRACKHLWSHDVQKLLGCSCIMLPQGAVCALFACRLTDFLFDGAGRLPQSSPLSACRDDLTLWQVAAAPAFHFIQEYNALPKMLGVGTVHRYQEVIHAPSPPPLFVWLIWLIYRFSRFSGFWRKIFRFGGRDIELQLAITGKGEGSLSEQIVSFKYK